MSESRPTRELDEELALLRVEVERSLETALPSEEAWPATLHRAVRYSLFAGGKRIRPLLVLAAGRAVGGATEDLLPLACAVEMIHTYSLVHDDLPAMDDDDLRRGKPTCHKVFGEAIAILVGDALLTRAFHLLSEVPAGSDLRVLRRRLSATAVLGEAAGTTGLIGGQVGDLESTGRAVAKGDLERIHRAKTGALIRACVVGGGLAGGASEEQVAALRRYGSAIGLAFQVVDDVLDATEGPDRLGKTPGKDRSADKATYVREHGLEGARAIARGLLEEALGTIAPLGPGGATLAGIARRIVERRA